jgi:hypothetical protein
MWTVLVRRVVEARRLAASGGTAAAPPPQRPRTATVKLQTGNEKENPLTTLQTDENHAKSNSFWKKLRCW